MKKTIRINIAGHRLSITVENRDASVTLTRRADRECGHFRSDFGDCTPERVRGVPADRA